MNNATRHDVSGNFGIQKSPDDVWTLEDPTKVRGLGHHNSA